MKICSGSGVDRVSFTQSVLGPVTVVTDPVKVVTDYDPALVAKATPAKPTTAAKSTATASASSGSGSGSRSGSSGSGAPIRTASVSTSRTVVEVAAPPPPDLPDMDRKKAYKTFSNDD
jgi:hypothetical protein